MNSNSHAHGNSSNEVEEFIAVHTVLEGDYTLSYVNYGLDQTGDNAQFWIRNSIRSLFAHVEGIVYGLKRLSYTKHVATNSILSVEEIAALQELGYEVKENGDVEERKQGIRTINNVRFTFKIVSKVFAIGWLPDFSSDGWENFRKALKIRHRITHPKSKADLTITSEEINIVNAAQGWWRNTLNGLFSRLGKRQSSSTTS